MQQDTANMAIRVHRPSTLVALVALVILANIGINHPALPTAHAMSGAFLYPSRRIRSAIYHGAHHLACWPSTGGIYELAGHGALDLQFLNLSRGVTTHAPATDRSEEDAFCTRLRLLGARWSSCSEWYCRHLGEVYGMGGEPMGCAVARERNVTITAWPAAGGVWAWSGSKEAGKKMAPLVGLALTMDERAEVVRTAGGAFYERAEDCLYLDLAPVNTTSTAAGVALDEAGGVPDCDGRMAESVCWEMGEPGSLARSIEDEL